MRLFLGTTLAAAALISIASPALAAWVELGSSNAASIELDTNRIQAEGQYRFYWVRLRYNPPLAGGTTRIDVHQSADCYGRTIRNRQTKAFNSRRQLIGQENLGDNAPAEIVLSGTLQGMAFDAVCQN